MTGLRARLSQKAASALPYATGVRLARHVDKPASLSKETFGRIITQMLDMPVELVPLNSEVPKEIAILSGAAVMLNGTAYVLYRNDGSLLHQLHVMAHEFYHLLAGHPGNSLLEQRIRAMVTNTLQKRIPNLRPDLVDHLVGRCVNLSDHRHEAAAEKFALSFIASLGLTEDRASATTTSGEEGRLSHLFSIGELP